MAMHATSVQPASGLKDPCRMHSPRNSAWDISIFQGMPLQEMRVLNEHFRLRRGFHHQLRVCGAEAVSHEGDEISLASTATSEDGDEIATKGAIVQSHSYDENAFQLSPSHNTLNVLDQDSVNKGSTVSLTWVVDAKKLRTRDQQIISPIFEISPQTSCRLMIKPTAMGDKKRQTTFLKSSGCGSIEFKLVDSAGPAPQLGIDISVGKGARARQSPGIVMHDFNRSSVCRLGDEWNFRSVVDAERSSFLVSVEVFV